LLQHITNIMFQQKSIKKYTGIKVLFGEKLASMISFHRLNNFMHVFLLKFVMVSCPNSRMTREWSEYIPTVVYQLDFTGY